MNPGYRLGHYRHAASDPRYPIELTAWDCLQCNPTHHACLRVDGQAGRQKKRKASNGEFHTSSRYNGVQLVHDSSLSQDISFSQGGLSESGLLRHPSMDGCCRLANICCSEYTARRLLLRCGDLMWSFSTYVVRRNGLIYEISRIFPSVIQQ